MPSQTSSSKTTSKTVVFSKGPTQHPCSTVFIYVKRSDGGSVSWAQPTFPHIWVPLCPPSFPAWVIVWINKVLIGCQNGSNNPLVVVPATSMPLSFRFLHVTVLFIVGLLLCCLCVVDTLWKRSVTVLTWLITRNQNHWEQFYVLASWWKKLVLIAKSTEYGIAVSTSYLLPLRKKIPDREEIQSVQEVGALQLKGSSWTNFLLNFNVQTYFTLTKMINFKVILSFNINLDSSAAVDFYQISHFRIITVIFKSVPLNLKSPSVNSLHRLFFFFF